MSNPEPVKLEICPFCGGQAGLIKSEEKINDWKITCSSCGIDTGWWMDKKAVISYWNGRWK